MFEHPDDAGFTYSSDSEWDNAEAYERGQNNPDQAWILTDRDVWHKNPYYQGPPVRHPEDYDDSMYEVAYEEGCYPEVSRMSLTEPQTLRQLLETRAALRGENVIEGTVVHLIESDDLDDMPF